MFHEVTTVVTKDRCCLTNEENCFVLHVAFFLCFAGVSNKTCRGNTEECVPLRANRPGTHLALPRYTTRCQPSLPSLVSWPIIPLLGRVALVLCVLPNRSVASTAWPSRVWDYWVTSSSPTWWRRRAVATHDASGVVDKLTAVVLPHMRRAAVTCGLAHGHVKAMCHVRIRSFRGRPDQCREERRSLPRCLRSCSDFVVIACSYSFL
jgi:hypothetical protein